MRTMDAGARWREQRLEKVRQTVQPKRRPGRLMYLCPICRKWTYSLSVHECGKRMSYPGSFG